MQNMAYFSASSRFHVGWACKVFKNYYIVCWFNICLFDNDAQTPLCQFLKGLEIISQIRGFLHENFFFFLQGSRQPGTLTTSLGCYAWCSTATQPFLDQKNPATVIHALVTSRHNCCNAFYRGCPCMARKLQVGQNDAALMLTGASSIDHIFPTWLPVAFHAQLKVLSRTYKALHGLGLGNLKHHFLH